MNFHNLLLHKHLYLRFHQTSSKVGDLGIKNVKMIPDGCGTFTRSLGMLVNKPKQGFGFRSWRYAAVINDMTVEHMFVEEGKNDFSDDDDPYEVSAPEYVLSKLQH
jgi:thioredoxin-dependent peroxiredoxin